MSTKIYKRLTHSSSNKIKEDLLAVAIFIGLASLSIEAFADTSAGGIEVAKKISSTLSIFLKDDARAAINGAILAGGGIGAAMARTWLPIGMSALGIGLYEVIRVAL